MTMRLPSTPNARAALILSLILAGLAACFSDRSATSLTTTTTPCTVPGSAAGATAIFIHGFAFDPPLVHVKAGASVAWVNCETNGASHTATSDASAFNSGTVTPTNAFIHPFPVTGTFPYHCDIHPFMKATVIVE